MDDTLPHDTLLYMFHKNLSSVGAIAEDLAHYERQDTGHRDKTYEYLYNSVKRHIAKHHEEANYKAYTGGGPQGGAMPAPEGTQRPEGKGRKGEKKDKGKGRGGGNTTSPQNPGPKKDKSEIPCRFHILGDCRSGKDCQYSHKPVSDAVKAEILAKHKQ